MAAKFLAVVFLAVPLLDAVVMVSPRLGGAGVVAWLLLWLALATRAVGAAVSLLATARRRPAAALPLFAALFVFAAVVIHLNDPRVLHHETTQEIGCALRTLATSPSRGWADTCLFGYPTRQHLLPALPSLFLGRTQTALHVGSAAYLLVGLLVFAHGLAGQYEQRRDGFPLAALVVVLLTHFYFFHHFMLAFEQSVYPMLFTMTATGLVLCFENRPNSITLWLVGFAVLASIHAYTPALATVGLACLWLLSTARRPDVPAPLRRTAVVVLVGSLTSLGLSFAYRSEQFADRTRSIVELAADLREAAYHLFIRSAALETFTPALTAGVFALALAACLAGAAGWRGAAVAAWILAVFAAALVMRGYTWYAVHFRLHRALVATPLLAALVGEVWRRWAPDGRRARALLAVALGVVAAAGLALQHTVLTTRGDGRQAAFIAWWRETAPVPAGAPAELYVLPAEHEGGLVNIDDFLQYFEPAVKSRALLGETDCTQLRARLKARQEATPVLALTTSLLTLRECAAVDVPQPLATFSFSTDTPLMLVPLDSSRPRAN